MTIFKLLSWLGYILGVFEILISSFSKNTFTIIFGSFFGLVLLIYGITFSNADDIEKIKKRLMID